MCKLHHHVTTMIGAIAIAVAFPADSYAATLQEGVVEVARQNIGKPYKFGGDDPSGFDSAGFVRYVYAANGVLLPRTTREQSRAGQRVSFDRAIPGDIVLLSSGNGIYAGHGDAIIALPGEGVRVVSLAHQSVSGFVHIGS
jgi:cell wall-associated NlpC family hydrolase